MHNGWKLSRIAAMFVIVFGIGGAAWAQDQCSMPTVGVGTGSVGNATGPNTCGVVITVTLVVPGAERQAFRAKRPVRAHPASVATRRRR